MKPSAQRGDSIATCLAASSLAVGVLGFMAVVLIQSVPRGETWLEASPQGLWVVSVILGSAALLRMRRARVSNWIRTLAVAGLLTGSFALYLTLLGGGLLIAIRASKRASNERVVCYVNMVEILAAIQMYDSESANGYPHASRWCDNIKPVLSDQALLNCPFLSGGHCGYAYNAGRSGVHRGDLAKPELAVVVFESDAWWNAVGGQELLPRKPRHMGGDNYGFADGSVRRYRRSDAHQLQ